jgi:hypothetical protein
MRPSQQLVALVMLGIQAEELLLSSPFRFEILSSHLAKCAIAASSVIALPSRPNLATVLTQIGFKVDEKNTSDHVNFFWERLSTFKVADHMFHHSHSELSETRFMKVELELFETGEGKHLLQIDKFAFEALSKMRPASETSRFVLPCAWINYGASPLADGFVTFLCTHDVSLWATTPIPATASPEGEPPPSDPPNGKPLTTDHLEIKPFRFTLMIQAKDYHNGTSLNATKLAKHARSCNDGSLDGVFGKTRLLCVAGSSTVVRSSKKCPYPREFMPYVPGSGHILTKLLACLELKRNMVTRAFDHALLCDADSIVYDINGTLNVDQEFSL